VNAVQLPNFLGVADVGTTEIKTSLRSQLRSSTSGIHERLDRSVSGADLLHPVGYTRFLTCQLTARDAIEDWADLHCPALLRPPSTSELLRKDIADLARDLGDDASSEALGGYSTPFALPAQSDPIGLAWAIAGSHMGNKAMLARLRKAEVSHGRPPMPCRFLADARMTGFWRALLPRLEEPCSAAQAEPAVRAAHAVFARFEEAFDSGPARCKQAA